MKDKLCPPKPPYKYIICDEYAVIEDIDKLIAEEIEHFKPFLLYLGKQDKAIFSPITTPRHHNWLYEEYKKYLEGEK